MPNHLLIVVLLFKKLIRWPVRLAFSCYGFFREGLKPYRSLLSSVLRILRTFENRSHHFIGENNCCVRINTARNSPTLVRDLLIFLNTVGVQVSSSGNNRIDNMIVYINGDEQFDHFSEVYSCFHLNSLIVDTHFYWSNGIRNEDLTSLGILADKVLPHGLQTSINDSYVPIQSIAYFNTCESNLLDTPESIKVWARNVLKGYKPGSFIVCIHLPEFNKEDSANMLRNWRAFFMKAGEDFPHIHFLLLNFSIDWDDEELAIDLPNTKVTKMLGYNLLEEFALVQLSDMFIGAYDKYAIAVIGTTKPFILFGLSDTDMSQISDEINYSTRQLNRGKHQIWILDIPSPVDFYVKFKQFYIDVVEHAKPGTVVFRS